MTIYNTLRAILSGRKPFYVPRFRRVTFATNKQQCLGKFCPHKVKQIGILQYVIRRILSYSLVHTVKRGYVDINHY